MNTKITALTLALLMGAWGKSSAQDYDDDDIYFNPSKSKKQETTIKNSTTKQPNGMIYYPVTDYPAADTYTVPVAGRECSVDEYNRRGFFATDTVQNPVDSINSVAFANTRRIEKFYNPTIVTNSTDAELAQYYYAQPANVNIIVNAYDPWYSYPYYSPYYYGYWDWRNPWVWSTSWAWNYPWGPSWAWGWGPSWSWAWRPPYPAWAHHPVHPGRPGRPGNVRPGTSTSHSGYRPGNSGYRPASGNSGYRPGSSSGYRPGRGGSSNNSSGYRRPSSSSNNNNSGYRPGSTRNSSSSWGGASSGGYRGGNTGGFSRGGGGGRGRH